eukprot:TRINITY_DN1459_c0_g1_i2.p1 TRINITY_DN1459_c0_g1~~TRINITY_DN1459_c0_g1_i2.p1  ORF type:complete len:414 (+),score=117.28 TRINITY_DN1459_c0_g1_i2:27-1268(+)
MRTARSKGKILRRFNDMRGRFPFPLHPTGLEVGGSEAAGAVIGNFSITIGFTLLMLAALELFKRVGERLLPSLFEGMDTQGMLRFPSAPLFIFQWLYQGTVLGAMILLLYPANTLHVVLGLVAMAVCVSVPVLLFRVVTRDVPSMAVYALDPEKQGWLQELVCGPGEWVSVGVDVHWVNRYASVTRSFVQRAVWFSVIEFAAAFALAAIGTLETSTLVGCGHVKLAMAAVFLILVVVEAVLWPCARPRDNMADFVTLGIQGAGLVLMAVGFYKGYDVKEHLTHHVAGLLFMASAVLLVVKGVVDLCTEAYVVLTGRRNRLQADAWQASSSLLMHDMCNVSVSTQPASAVTSPLSASVSRSRRSRLTSSLILPASTSMTGTGSSATFTSMRDWKRHEAVARGEMASKKFRNFQS